MARHIFSSFALFSPYLTIHWPKFCNRKSPAFGLLLVYFWYTLGLPLHYALPHTSQGRLATISSMTPAGTRPYCLDSGDCLHACPCRTHLSMNFELRLAKARQRAVPHRVSLEEVRHLAGHADPRTTRLYDRRQRKSARGVYSSSAMKRVLARSIRKAAALIIILPPVAVIYEQAARYPRSNN